MYKATVCRPGGPDEARTSALCGQGYPRRPLFRGLGSPHGNTGPAHVSNNNVLHSHSCTGVLGVHAPAAAPRRAWSPSLPPRADGASPPLSPARHGPPPRRAAPRASPQRMLATWRRTKQARLRHKNRVCQRPYNLPSVGRRPHPLQKQILLAAEEMEEFAPVSRVLCCQTRQGQQLVLLDWEEPAGGFPADAFAFEDTTDLDGDPALRNASWRPRTSLVQPCWSVSRWRRLPVWPNRRLTVAEEEVL
mmetsp:Transcript_27466/g.66913  ORF Transcript_27466/g.66913 Transcript_27466/m.66913 type:complete len:248 (-) Transcript_27466:68-811(-)